MLPRLLISFFHTREFLTYTMMSEADFDAHTLKKSMDGIGTKEKLMIFVVAPQGNERVLAARARYDEKVVKT